MPPWSVRDALQFDGVYKEVRHAIKVQKQRGRDKFPVIPLSTDGTKLGALEKVFGTEPTYILVSGAPAVPRRPSIRSSSRWTRNSTWLRARSPGPIRLRNSFWNSPT